MTRRTRAVSSGSAQESSFSPFRRAHALVGRAVNPQLRSSDEPKEDDYIFRGFELDDALNEANGALTDDLRVSREEGIKPDLEPFEREKILARLEHWFFHHDDEATG